MRSYFDRLLGNEDTKARIGRAIESGTLPHAFLIGGPSGSGKTTLATEISAAINCEEKHNPTSPLPCGRCNNCRRIYEGNVPDIKTLSKKKDKAPIGVEAVKDFREDMFLSSTEAESTIYIIDDAQTMTPEAQNALLKVLEEPPGSVIIFLLATECDRILTTIKSRAQYIPMARFGEEELARLLLSESSEARLMNSTDSERFMGIIMSSDGRLGVAKSLLNRRSAEENQEEREEIISILSVICQRSSYAEIHSVISKLPNKRQELSAMIERLMRALRDAIILQYSDNARTLFFADADAVKKCCGNASVKKLLSLYETLNEAHELCYKNANLTNLLSNMAAQIKIKSMQ